jgi:predicted amidohydrolase
MGRRQSQGMKTYRRIFEEHGSMLLARSEKARTDIACSLECEGASPLTVGVFQMRNNCGGEDAKRRNLERMIGAILAAAEAGMQLLAFPEMCLPGYFTPVSGTPEEAILANRGLSDMVTQSAYLQNLQETASEARIALAFGFCERDGDTLYNAIGVIDADGAWLGTRRKNPLYPWPYETDSFNEPGPEARAVVFKTKYATVGISNCFDGEFLESIRQMRLAGAGSLLWCNAGVGNAKLGTSNRINFSGAHAQANNMWVACCNCVAENTSGTSVIVSNNGEPLVILPPNEEALGVATLDLGKTRHWDPWQSRVDRRGYQG